MRTTSCRYPTNEAMIIIRKSQLDFCDGNACDAAVLSYLEYWHTIKETHHAQAKGRNDIAEAHGDPRTQDESCWQFHTEQDILEGIQFIKTSRTSIRASIKRLEEKGAVTTSRNPNPQYKFDRTTWFLFHPEIINEWLDSRLSKNEKPSSKNRQSSSNYRPPSSNTRRTITEITSEITSEREEEEYCATPATQSRTNISPASQPKQPSLPDQATRLAQLLADSIVANYPDSRAPTPASIQQWAKEIDRLNRIDGKDWSLIERVLSWSQHDPFWKQNILSGQKFRKQWNRLLAGSGVGRAGTATSKDSLQEAMEREGREYDPNENILMTMERMLKESEEREVSHANGIGNNGRTSAIEAEFSRMGEDTD